MFQGEEEGDFKLDCCILFLTRYHSAAGSMLIMSIPELYILID